MTVEWKIEWRRLADLGLVHFARVLVLFNFIIRDKLSAPFVIVDTFHFGEHERADKLLVFGDHGDAIALGDAQTQLAIYALVARRVIVPIFKVDHAA